MSYSVTVYKNTGFNAVNIPDSPALLESASKLTALPTLEILQDSGLSEVYLKATYNEINGADYVRIGSWYYIVDGAPIMTSVDVCRLLLIPDFVTSAGGAGNLSYTDGVTERVCVPTSSDDFGAYTEDDELTAPSQSLNIQHNMFTYSSSGETSFVESTLDLYAGATDNSGITYEDPATHETCTVPYMPTVTSQTTHKYGGGHGTITYNSTFPSVKEGMKRARGLGVESGIIAQYTVPNIFIDSATAIDSATGAYTNMAGREDEQATTINFEQGTVQNKRCLYGEYTKYGILTMGGNKAEFKAEDIYESGASAPSVKYKADIRADGRPYWRFKSFLGDSSDDGFWRNCLAGARWENVPLVYSEKSGNLLDRQEYEADRKMASAQFGEQMGSMAGGVVDKAIGGAIAGGVGGAVVGGAVGLLSTGLEMYRAYDRFHEEGELSALKFGQSQVSAPQITFPFNTDIMRDALYNTAIIYRYVYTSFDLVRIDKLLTMYGYKHTKALESSDFTNRSKFNYVKTRGGVTSTSNGSGRLPKWWNDGVSAQLSAGVRVWHILPTVSAYNSNP